MLILKILLVMSLAYWSIALFLCIIGICYSDNRWSSALEILRGSTLGYTGLMLLLFIVSKLYILQPYIFVLFMILFYTLATAVCYQRFVKPSDFELGDDKHEC